MNTTLLLVLGLAIIIALSAYATSLLLKLKKQDQLQRQQQKLAIDKRNANIFENVETLCLAGIQGQCDLSEISIRLCNILDYVQGEKRVDIQSEYPALYELFTIVDPMARGDDRSALPKKQRMQETLTRHKAESRLQDSIIDELKQIRIQLSGSNEQIAIKMV